METQTRSLNINAGEIFCLVLDNWQQYKHDFLKGEFCDAFSTLSIRVSDKYKVFRSDSGFDHLYRSYCQDREIIRAQKDQVVFPFPQLALFPLETELMDESYLVLLEQVGEVTPESQFYSMFVALDLNHTSTKLLRDKIEAIQNDLIEIDSKRFKTFFENVLVGYRHVLMPAAAEMIERIIGGERAAAAENNRQTPSLYTGRNRKCTPLTLRQRNLAVQFLLESEVDLGYDGINIALFIQSILNEQTNCADITNSKIYTYRRLYDQRPLIGRDLADFMVVLEFFKSIKAKKIVEKIEERIRKFSKN